MNTFLGSLKTTQNITDANELNDSYHLKQRIRGIAIKLSNLKTLNISFIDLLRHYDGNIIIDAEYTRLDQSIEKICTSNNLTVSDKNRIFVTVQAKRRDAKEQIKNLRIQGIKIVLVIGNRHYLDDLDEKSDGIAAIYNLYKKFDNIEFLGISNKTKNKIEMEYSIRLSEKSILELYGEQKMKFSSLWVYYSGKILSQNAKNYIQRRKNGSASIDINVDRYLVSSIKQLIEVSYTQDVILFVDGYNKISYFHNLDEILSFIT